MQVSYSRCRLIGRLVLNYAPPLRCANNARMPVAAAHRRGRHSWRGLIKAPPPLGAASSRAGDEFVFFTSEQLKLPSLAAAAAAASSAAPTAAAAGRRSSSSSLSSSSDSSIESGSSIDTSLSSSSIDSSIDGDSTTTTTTTASTTAATIDPVAATAHDNVDISGKDDDDDDDWLQRTRLLYGADGLARLAAAHVLIVGLGGVGSFAAEFLARAGVGALTIVDGDAVDATNRNRQLPALRSTVGRPKADVVAARLRDINPKLKLAALREFLDPDSAAALVSSAKFDFVVDAIDSIAPKQHLLLAAAAAGVPAVSSMGAGGRVDPSRVRAADLQDTYGDALAAHVRRGLRKKGFTARGIVAVFSDEPAARASLALTDQRYKQSYFGTNSYMPGLFGLWMAQHVIRTLVGERNYRVPRQPPPMAGKGSSSGGSGRSSSGSGSSSSGRGGGRQKSSSTGGSGGGSSNKASRSSDADSSGSIEQRGGSSGGGGGGGGGDSKLSASDAHNRSSSSSSSSTKSPGAMFGSYSRAAGTGMGWDGSGI